MSQFISTSNFPKLLGNNEEGRLRKEIQMRSSSSFQSVAKPIINPNAFHENNRFGFADRLIMSPLSGEDGDPRVSMLKSPQDQFSFTRLDISNPNDRNNQRVNNSKF